MPLLFLLFLVVPLVELFVLIQVGQVIGVWWTIGLLLADSVLGTMLMRSQGRAAWRRLNEAIAAGRPPAREVLDGVLVVLGGALLLAPGFLTDIVGVLFLLPPTRALARGLLVRRFAARMITTFTGARRPGGGNPFGGGPFGPGGGGPRPASGRADDVDGTAVDVDAADRPLPRA